MAFENIKKLEDLELLGYRILIPYKVELEKLFESHGTFTFVRDPETGRADDENSKIVFSIANISVKDKNEIRPIVSFKRGAIQRDRGVVGNIGGDTDILSGERIYGEILRFTVKITVTARNPIECEKISDIVFYIFEWNKNLTRKHGITDSYVDYKSELVPIEGSGESTIESWQIGVNITGTIHEVYALNPLTEEKAIREFDFLKSIDNYASISKKYEK